MQFKQGISLDDSNFDLGNYSALVDLKLLLKQILGGCSSDIASSYWFRSNNVTEHVTSRVSGDKFKTK